MPGRHVEATQPGLVLRRPGVNFTNILHALFLHKSLMSSFSVDKLRFDFSWRKDIGAKAAHKTLVKLTTVVLNRFCYVKP